MAIISPFQRILLLERACGPIEHNARQLLAVQSRAAHDASHPHFCAHIRSAGGSPAGQSADGEPRERIQRPSACGACLAQTSTSRATRGMDRQPQCDVESVSFRSRTACRRTYANSPPRRICLLQHPREPHRHSRRPPLLPQKSPLRLRRSPLRLRRPPCCTRTTEARSEALNDHRGVHTTLSPSRTVHGGT